ncbi:MAG: flagellar basal body P-ring protein FlgI [Bryobacteraceae bacterium]|nr:flagellar basal body P-ring protein FlgI [Bryobacteraceae bacterium]
MKTLRRSIGIFLAVLIAGAAAEPGRAATARLKDLASLEGARDNQLVGYGLVVGLAGTGDKRQTVFSAQTLANLLQRMGVAVDPKAILVRNMAAVMVTADLPPFAQPGTRIDVTVAAVGDATNLQGGLLVITPLKAANGQVYAVAQGSVLTGGFVAGRGGNSRTLNHPTAGRIPNGAIVEREPPSTVAGPALKWQLRESDFTTAARVAAAVNKEFAGAGAPLAKAENGAVVSVRLPEEYASRSVEFVAAIENLTIETDRLARIVINERTGTIVMGKQVQIAPVSILHGALTVEVRTTLIVSQPQAFGAGQTTVVPDQEVKVGEEQAKNIQLDPGATVEDLVRALLAIGSTPRDVIAILQNLRAAGALEAEVEVI